MHRSRCRARMIFPGWPPAARHPNQGGEQARPTDTRQEKQARSARSAANERVVAVGGNGQPGPAIVPLVLARQGTAAGEATAGRCWRDDHGRSAALPRTPQAGRCSCGCGPGWHRSATTSSGTPRRPNAPRRAWLIEVVQALRQRAVGVTAIQSSANGAAVTLG
jgi:hypothetical protein